MASKKYNNYRNIIFLQNLYRIKSLEKYRKYLIKYFNNISYDMDRNIIDNEETYKIREYLNLHMDQIETYMNESSTVPNVIYSDPPIYGARRQRINLLENLFNIQNFDIENQSLIDFINQSIGVYKNDYLNSIFRTFNPFFILGLLLESIASIPFYILGSLGFDEKKAEESKLGKLIKMTIRIILFVIFLLSTISTLWDILSRLKIIPENFDLIKIIHK